MKHLLYILSLLFACSSCVSTTVSMCDLFPESATMQCNEKVFDIDSIRKPVDMYYVDGKLYMIDMYSSPLVTAFDWETGKYVGSFANRGQGPDEYLWFSTASSFNNKLGLYDTNKKEFVWFSFRDTVHSSSIKLAYSDTMFPFKVTALSDDYFVATGLIEENKRFVLYNKNGEKVSVFGDYPKENPDADYGFQANAFAYQPTGMVYNPEKRVFAVGGRDGQIISFYDMSDVTHPKLLKEHIASYPRFHDESTGKYASVRFLSDNITGFMGMAVTEKYCVGLFRGKPDPEDNIESMGGDKLLLFDWDGTPVKYVQLPQEYRMIASSERQIILLGFDSGTSEYIIHTIDICNL